VVDVEDIFDGFSYGISTPYAIRDFLSHAYGSWTPPSPRYVLLLGDGSNDYKDNRNVGTITYVPVYLTVTPYMGETISDDWFAQIRGDDATADLHIGRLPAATSDQARVMVEKILSYEASPNTKTWEKKVLLVSDNQTEEYEAVFEQMNETVASLLPTGFASPIRGYLNDYGAVEDLTAEIKERINEGVLLVHYSGHGSNQIWATERIFEHGNPPYYRQDVADCVNPGKYPVVVVMSCLTGYFGDPEALASSCLAEALLRPKDAQGTLLETRGAVAALMPTGMTTTEGQEILDQALFEAIFAEDIRNLGDAVSFAKEILLSQGSQYEDVSETFVLFGDPAMTLKVPLPRRPTGLWIRSTSGGVTLSWSEATDCNGEAVSGYNVFRSTTPGGDYTRINPSLLTQPEFRDETAAVGTTYCYVVTSVDADEDESVWSQGVSGALSALELEDSPAGRTPTSGRSDHGCFIQAALGRSAWE
jgi:hypothetical protein